VYDVCVDVLSSFSLLLASIPSEDSMTFVLKAKEALVREGYAKNLKAGSREDVMSQ
jgi:hypothetical protein